ncbi:MAG: ATP-binding protein [Thiobacillaceae bacterium]
MRNAIRRQLLAWQIGALLTTAALVSVVTYALAWNAFNRVRDFTMEQVAYTVLRHGVVTEPQDALEDRGQFLSQIWDDTGELVFSSHPDSELPQQPDGLHVLYWRGAEWHTYTLREGGLTIQVANTTANRQAMFARIVPWLILPMGLLIALLAAGIWFAVGRALRPLATLREEICHREPDKLQPVTTRDLPEELRPLAEALNALLTRLDAALRLQRRFIADAAHELRTPLAAVRLQAQLVQQATCPAEREAWLSRLIAGVDRASHMVQQLLDLARLDPQANAEPVGAVDLCALARTTVADFSVQAEATGIDLGLGPCEQVAMLGRARALRVLLNNLLDNALRHCPPGSRVNVEVHQRADGAWLIVRDNGPGIPEPERDKVFDRFYRLPGTTTGSGLGLAIVREIAQQHGGRVLLSATPGGGLTVSVVLPLAQRHQPPAGA